MGIVKAQIRLCICAVWSGPSLNHWTLQKVSMESKCMNELCACMGWIRVCVFCACSKTYFLSLGVASMFSQIKYQYFCWNYHIPYLPIFTYHTCPKIWNSQFYYLLMCLKYCCMYGKQCRPSSDTVFCSVWSGCILFAEAYLTQYLGLLWYDVSTIKVLFKIVVDGISFSYFFGKKLDIACEFSVKQKIYTRHQALFSKIKNLSECLWLLLWLAL